MKAVILARVSTARQEEEGHSLPAQLRRLQEYAKRKDFEVVETFSFSESAVQIGFELLSKNLKIPPIIRRATATPRIINFLFIPHSISI